MRNLLKRLRDEEDAATAVEYAIIAAVVGAALVSALLFFRENIEAMLRGAGDDIANNGN